MKTFLKIHFVIVHKLHYQASLAEWSKASDLSSDNRKIAWVRTPQLAIILNMMTWLGEDVSAGHRRAETDQKTTNRLSASCPLLPPRLHPRPRLLHPP